MELAYPMATVNHLNREVAAGSEWHIKFLGMTSRMCVIHVIIADFLETTLLT